MEFYKALHNVILLEKWLKEKQYIKNYVNIGTHYNAAFVGRGIACQKVNESQHKKLESL